MPQRKSKEHKCGHHTAAADEGSKWRNFHFSGKVIMCSVLFGLGLVLIGGLTLAIGMDQSEDEKSDDVNRIENKAPMSVVGPVIMGIGGFTVIVGIIMCFFETNICRKGKPDTRPLITEEAATGDSNQIDDSSQKRHKKISGKTNKRSSKDSPRNSPSTPVDVHYGSSREFTASDKFLTPPSSFRPGDYVLNANLGKPDNQTTFTNSGKSWNTSSEFRTPASSPEEHLSSFDIKNHITKERPRSPNLEIPTSNTLDPNQHEFLSPKNSYIGDSIYAKENFNSNSDQLEETISDLQNPEMSKDCVEQNFDMESSKTSPDVTVGEVVAQENVTEDIDQNSLVNNEIEKVEQCLEYIEQIKSNPVSNQINNTAIEQELNVDKPISNDVNVNHSTSDNTHQDNT